MDVARRRRVGELVFCRGGGSESHVGTTVMGEEESGEPWLLQTGNAWGERARKKARLGDGQGRGRLLAVAGDGI